MLPNAALLGGFAALSGLISLPSVHAAIRERFGGAVAEGEVVGVSSRGWTVTVDEPPSGKRVLVAGAGPSGLPAAQHLTRLGHAVTVADGARRPAA